MEVALYCMTTGSGNVMDGFTLNTLFLENYGNRKIHRVQGYQRS